MTEPVERPTPAVKVARSFKKGKRRGRKMAGFFMAFGGGVVGTVWGVASGMKEVITELLPPDEDEEAVEEARAARQLRDLGQSTGGVS